MPQSSALGYWAPNPAGSFEEGKPSSAWRAFELNQNLLHLTDEFAQTRINWIAADQEGIYEATPPTDPVVWHQVYAHRWLAPGKPANVDIHLGGQDLFARVRLVPYGVPVGSATSPCVFDEILDLSAGTPTTAEYTHQNTPANTAVYDRGWYKPAAVAAVGVDGLFEPQVCLMRLEITCLTEVAFQIVHVQLREFA